VIQRESEQAIVELMSPKDANSHARESQPHLPSQELLKAKLFEWSCE
jgi:hypothetical protein